MKENLNSTDPLLKISNLSVGFKSLEGFLLPVLRNIDLEVWRGESVGLQHPQLKWGKRDYLPCRGD